MKVHTPPLPSAGSAVAKQPCVETLRDYSVSSFRLRLYMEYSGSPVISRTMVRKSGNGISSLAASRGYRCELTLEGRAANRPGGDYTSTGEFVSVGATVSLDRIGLQDNQVLATRWAVVHVHLEVLLLPEENFPGLGHSVARRIGDRLQRLVDRQARQTSLFAIIYCTLMGMCGRKRTLTSKPRRVRAMRVSRCWPLLGG